MTARKISEKVFAVGAIDWDRRLFDELIPLPEGTSYNSYLVKGSQKTILLDTVDPSKLQELLDNLAEANAKQIDYIIAHHAEQDHSGSLPEILKRFPGAKILTNQKCKDFLIDLLHLADDNFELVSDGQVISLGDMSLEIIFTPWVHWPETFCTFLKEEGILFSCDFFGSHLATSELYGPGETEIIGPAKRYFAEIMMPFRTQIRKNLARLAAFPIKTIAPSHGPVYKKPSVIIDAYKDWTSENVKNEVIIPFVSMHGSTVIMVEHLVNALTARGIIVKPYLLSRTDLGELAMSLVDAATIVIGSPTVLAGAHPQAIYAAFLANALRPKTKFLSVIGSYGWGGKMLEQLSAMIPNLKVEVIPPVIIKGHPKHDDLKLIDDLAEAILQKHKTAGLL
jgi:flavorubredoxin